MDVELRRRQQREIDELSARVSPRPRPGGWLQRAVAAVKEEEHRRSTASEWLYATDSGPAIRD
jgi:hypothetical protein